MCGIDVRKRAFGPQTPKTTLWVNLSEFGFFFYHDRLWCSGDLEFQCHVTETNFLCAGSRLGVRHQPSIRSSKRLTSQAPQVPPGFQASSTLRSWLCTRRSTDAHSAGPVSSLSVARNRDWAAVTASLCILAHVAQSCCTQAARMLKSRSSTCMHVECTVRIGNVVSLLL